METVLYVKKIVFSVPKLPTASPVQQVISFLVAIVLNVCLDVVSAISITMLNVLNALMDIICKEKESVFYAQLDAQPVILQLPAKPVQMDIN